MLIQDLQLFHQWSNIEDISLITVKISWKHQKRSYIKTFYPTIDAVGISVIINDSLSWYRVREDIINGLIK